MTRYATLINGEFHSVDAIASSAGAADADKLIQLSGDGQLDHSFIKGSSSFFQVGASGVGLRTSSGVLQVRNSSNSGQATIQAQNFNIAGGAAIAVSGSEVRARNASNTSFTDFQCAKATASSVDSAGLLWLPLGSPEGLTISRPTATSIAIAAGRAVIDSLGGRYVGVNSASFTKNLTATWAAGNSNAGINGAVSLSANTTYHVFMIMNTAGVIDFMVDTSLTPTFPLTYSVGRIIGSILTDGSGNIRDFLQVGDEFRWASEIVDLSTSNLSTSTSNLQALTVPNGLRVRALFRFETTTSSTASAFAGPPGAAATIIGDGNVTGAIRHRTEEITNTSRQITLYANGASMAATIATYGFIHPRGAW